MATELVNGRCTLLEESKCLHFGWKGPFGKFDNPIVKWEIKCKQLDFSFSGVATPSEIHSFDFVQEFLYLPIKGSVDISSLTCKEKCPEVLSMAIQQTRQKQKVSGTQTWPQNSLMADALFSRTNQNDLISDGKAHPENSTIP